ncbi:TPA: hypothetical protein ACSCYS_004263 [Aeromonas veronii]
MATEVTKFDPLPSGNYGVAIEMISFKGKSKRIAHTHLMAQGHEPDKIHLSVPASVTLAELKALAERLTAYAGELDDLNKSAPQAPEKG